jgi:hypothetical protein
MRRTVPQDGDGPCTAPVNDPNGYHPTRRPLVPRRRKAQRFQCGPIFRTHRQRTSVRWEFVRQWRDGEQEEPHHGSIDRVER